ncbi:MAG: IS200/IS605 family transposase [Methanohalobium sp.]|uniref:IS200/IS605 family transposase n=1 Tax=Methanohalobium sp. TaxID=2837493 RepID=UPI003978C513
MVNRWTYSNTTVFNIGYHLIWCSKYSKNVLVDDVEKRLRGILSEKADEIDVDIEHLEIMPDNIHLFVKTPPTASPHWVVQQLKGYSSSVLREEFPHLKSRLPTLWTRSYYCESVGHISEEAVKKYTEEQKNQ